MVRKIIYGLICLPFLVVSFIANAQVAVTTGGPPTNYATLTAAFTAINNGTHTGSITITLTANHTLTAAAILNASGTGSANYSSISISPNTNVTISSSLNAIWAIYLVGADNVTFDGLNTSGNSLTIKNTSTSCYGVFVLYNGASYNTIKNCTILSSAASYGTITFYGAIGSNNDFNTISNNNIGGTSTTVDSAQVRAIFAENGVVTTSSKYNTISNNNIYNFFRLTAAVGIQIGNGHNNWTISNNKFYQTASITGSSAPTYHYPIYISRTSAEGRMDILNNTIGYASSSGTGNYTVSTPNNIGFYGITVNSPATDTVNIQGNTIKNIAFGSALSGVKFIGVYVTGGVIAYVGDQTGNTIGDTSSHSVTLTHTAGAGTSISYGMYIVNNNILARINNNTVSGIKSIATTNSLAISLRGIYVISCSIDSIYNNKIGSFTTSSNIQLGSSVSTANHYFSGIEFVSSGGALTYISKNSIANVLCYGSGTTAGSSQLTGIRHGSGNPCIINENTISNLSTYSGCTQADYQQALTGIYSYTSSGTGGEINNNIISSLTNLNTTAANISTSGILYYTGSNTPIYRNKILNIGINGSASGTIANGIQVISGNAHIANNFIHINNSLTQNVRGVNITGGSSHTCQYNTILIEGTNTLTGATACFFRNNVTMSVQNNIFFNKRSSSGTNYSLYNNTSIFTGATIGYNLHVVPNTSTAIYHNSAARTWANYYTVQNTSDRFSWCESTTNLAATSLFTNTTTSDLTINSSNSACWYVNGKGWPISGLDYDWENLSGDRSAAITDGGTDIGADEFTTSTTPPTAAASAAPAAGTTTTYTFAGKTVASIAWTGGSNVPASVSVWYYSGNNPPVPIPGKNAFNCYWRIEPSSTPSGMSYTPTLYFSDALLGAVPSTTDLRMAKNSGLTPNINNWSCACASTTVNATNRTFAPTTPYTSFSIFTGTDINAPLPVELISFTASKQDKDILLHWQTASEKNSERFDIERSYNGVDFEYTGKSVSAADISNTLRSYTAIDEEYAHTATVVYYRLKIVDYDGYFEYSTIAAVTINTTKQTAATVHPNPFGNSTTLTLQNAVSGSIEIAIMDLSGNQLYSQNYDHKNPEEEIKIDTGFLKSGTYMLRVVTAQESVIKKIVRY